jgi:outer membrane receptor for ferrienterochelin and colicins
VDWQGVYALELIPATMIERIEVVRGGGSALFGGNAIAGTVNIITKEPTRNTFSVDGRYGVIGITGDSEHVANPAPDYQLNVNTSVVTDDSKSGGYIYAMLRDKDAYDENGDGFSEEVLMENSTFGFNAFHKPGSKSKISIDGYRLKEFRRGGNKLDLLPHQADIAEQLDHLITGANLSFDLFTNDNYNELTLYSAGQIVDRDSYYGGDQDPSAYGFSKDYTGIVGAQYIANADNFLFAPSSTVFGIENQYNNLEDSKLGVNGEPNTILTKQTVNTFGAFVQHDWRLKNLNLSAGLRIDNYMIKDIHKEEVMTDDFTETVLVPRISAMYKITPSVRFRASYASGYRAPQVFNEDLHIELIGAKRVTHINDDNLTKETSHSFTSSLNSNFLIGNTINDLLIEGFYTRLNDAFADEYYEIDSLGEDFAYKRTNVEGYAHVYGVNIEINSHINELLSFQAGLTLQKSEFEVPIEWGDGQFTADFLRTPNTYGFMSFTIKPSKRFSATLSANYTGSMNVPHVGVDLPEQWEDSQYDEFLATGSITPYDPEPMDPSNKELVISDDRIREIQEARAGNIIFGEELETSETFLLVDLFATYNFPLTKETSFQVYAGVKNIFNQTQERHDRGVLRDAGYIYGPCEPTSISVGFKLGNIF